LSDSLAAMGTPGHRNKKKQTRTTAVSPRLEQPCDSIPGAAADAFRDHTLDYIFDPAHVRLSSVMQRQSELVTLARHFAIASIFVPVAGVVLGLLAVLFAREAQDMFDLVGGSAFDQGQAHRALVTGGIMTGVWLIGSIVLIAILAPRGF